MKVVCLGSSLFKGDDVVDDVPQSSEGIRDDDETRHQYLQQHQNQQQQQHAIRRTEYVSIPTNGNSANAYHGHNSSIGLNSSTQSYSISNYRQIKLLCTTVCIL